jgi:uncharacterized protein DUF6506
MTDKKFKAVFIAFAPDSNYPETKTEMQTGKYHLISILVKDVNQAVEASKELVEKEGVHSFLLCPGFTHKAIAKIVDAVGEGISVNVSRGDGPSGKAAFKKMNEVGWFS